MLQAPIDNPLPIRGADGKSSPLVAFWPRPWTSWLLRVVNALGWSFALTATKVIDFGSISTASEASDTVTVTGASTTNTPSVIVTPSENTAGIVYSGVVTASDTVTIYAKNFTAGSINPASATFRVVVLQP